MGAPPLTLQRDPALTTRRYHFDTVHPAAKQFGINSDMFMYGFEPLAILLWHGDLATARAGFAKVLDAHRRILERVRQGEASADG